MTGEDLMKWAEIAAAAPPEVRSMFVEADKAYHKFMVEQGIPNPAAIMLVAGWHERRCAQLMDALDGLTTEAKDEEE